MTQLTNEEIARVFESIAHYLAMDDIPWKPRAYQNAADTIIGYPEPLSAIYEKEGVAGIEAIPGIGKSLADHVRELLETGKLAYLTLLKKKIPVDIDELLGIQGLGPKTIKALYQALKITNRAKLERAAKQGKIRSLPGFGEKKEAAILKSLAASSGGTKRFLAGEIMPKIEAIRDALAKIPGVSRADIAGSLRRGKDTAGDADILVASKDATRVMDVFTNLPEVRRILAKGETKSSVVLGGNLQVDLRVVNPSSYGAALQYFTGSKEHNVALREIAIQKGWKLNEYGLYKGETLIAGKTEESIYEKLGLLWIPPEMREMKGELELAREDALPKLVGYGDLKGDLQVQTDWTDGSASIEVMAKAAYAAGLAYIAITDHTKRLAMTHGLDEKRLLLQGKEIERVNEKFKKERKQFRILKGTECDILKDGSLDLKDEVLKTLDMVGISVHSHFDLPEKEQTERIIRAMQNPYVTILFHPTGRRIGKRPPYALDMEAIIKEAKKKNIILEANASPERLDLQGDHIRMAIQAGVRIAVNSDAHDPSHFGFLRYGIAQARRGWATKKDVVNTASLLKFLKR